MADTATTATPSLALNQPANQATDLSSQAFLVIFLAITLSSILIVLYTDVIKNFAYGTLHLNNQSTWHSLVLALVVTGIFLVVLYIINSYGLIAAENEAQSTTTILGTFPPGVNSFEMVGPSASVYAVGGRNLKRVNKRPVTSLNYGFLQGQNGNKNIKKMQNKNIKRKVR